MINFATLDDIDELVSLENSMFDERKYFRLTYVEFLKLLKKPSTKLFVYKDGTKIAGYALGVVLDHKNMWFNSLAVLREYQQTTIAKELFEAVVNHALTHSFKGVVLEIRADNKALFRRYSHIGYSVFKDIKNYYPDGMSAIRMIKFLSS